MNQQIHGLFDEALDFPACINASNWTKSYGDDETNYYYYYSYLSKKKRDFFMDRVYYTGFGNIKPYNYNYYNYSYGDGNPPYNCVEDFESTYLNRNDVQEALHVNTTRNITWIGCSNINYNSTDIGKPMEPIYQYLVNTSYDNLHITIYAGDDDSVCAPMAVQQWIYNMSWTLEKSWTSWLYQDETNNWGQQLGGYYVKFKDAVNFITVHTAGHEVPFFRPQKALIILQKYLNGEI